MTSYVTPLKNIAFIMYIALPSQSNPNIFQSTPTLAAGDFKVSIDGGTLNNLTTLPTVTPASNKMVKVSLSSSEMNGDNITVVCSDAAGAEWRDVVINIQTSVRQIDDLAFPTTSGRSIDVTTTGEVGLDWANIGAPTTTVNLSGTTVKTATDVTALLPTALVSGRIDASVGAMASGVVTATAIATDAIGAAELAADAATEIANAVWDTTVSGHVTTGTFGVANQGTRTATAQAGAAGTITLDSSASATDDLYNGCVIAIISGSGAGQSRLISDYVGSTKVASVTPNWITNPSVTSIFVIVPHGYVFGLVTGAIAAATFAAGAIDATAIANGAIDAATFAAGAIDATAIANAAIDAATFAAGAIDASAIATDAIGSAEVAATAATKIAQAVWDLLTTAILTTGSIGKLLKDDIDTTISSRASQTSVDTIDDYVDTEVAAIKAKTDNLPASPAAVGDIPTAAVVADAVWDEIASGHVTAGSFGQALQPMRASTAQAGASGSITLDASASITDDLYKGCLIAISSGTGAGQARLITGYTGSSKIATVSPNWITNPSSSSIFAVLPFGYVAGLVSALTGSITSGSFASGAIDASAIATDAIGAAELAAGAASEIGQAVWDIATSTMVTAGSAGKLVTDNLNATVSSRATQASVDTIDDFVDTEVAAIKAKTDNLPTDPADASDIAAAFAALNDVSVDDIFAGVVEGSLTVKDSLRLVLSVLLGKATGGGTTTVTFRDTGDATDRIVATIDTNGNRSSVTLDPS